MEISKERILGLANQIYMDLSDEEIQKLCKDVGQVVESTQILKEVDIFDIKSDVAVLDNCYNALRKDKVVVYEEKEALLQNAKEVEQGMFRIPKIV